MDIYVSGRITGESSEKSQRWFHAWCAALQNLGHRTINPRDILPWGHGDDDHVCPVGRRNPNNTEHTDCCYLRSDLYQLLSADAVLAIPGWQYSTGSRLEVNVAMECGIPVYEPAQAGGFCIMGGPEFLEDARDYA